MQKTRVAIIGTGNIGIDILMKVMKSDLLTCSLFIGRNLDSKGIKIANSMGVPTSTNSIDSIIENPDCCEIIFDATTASSHKKNAIIFEKLGIFAIDLTPAHYGDFCVPVINLKEKIKQDMNVNLVTCGGQAAVPIIKTISEIEDNIEYVELVATISSRSAGPGTRNNIDEYTQTTKEAIVQFSGIKNAKAIIVLNPAEPPITMRNTIYMKIKNPNIKKITQEIRNMESRIQKYVPGYKITLGPLYDGNKLTIVLEVEGAGDYLPKYSGNLDIITSAAIQIAEEYSLKRGQVNG